MKTERGSHPHEMISALIDGELGPAEKAEVEGHLTICAACRDLFRDLGVLDAAIAAERPPDVPAGLPERIAWRARAELGSGRLGAPGSPGRSWWANPRRLAAWSPIAVGGLAAAAILGFLFMREGGPTGPSVISEPRSELDLPFPPKTAGDEAAPAPDSAGRDAAAEAIGEGVPSMDRPAAAKDDAFTAAPPASTLDRKKVAESLDALQYRQRLAAPTSGLAPKEGQTLAPGSSRPVDQDSSRRDASAPAPDPSADLRPAPARTPAQTPTLTDDATRGRTNEIAGPQQETQMKSGKPAADEERQALDKLQRERDPQATSVRAEIAEQNREKANEKPAADERREAVAYGSTADEKEELALGEMKKGKESEEAGAGEKRLAVQSAHVPAGPGPASTAPAEGVVVEAAATCATSQPAIGSPVKIVTADTAAFRADLARIAGRLKGRLSSPTEKVPYWMIEVPAGALPELLASLRRLGAELPPASDRAAASVECYRVLIRLEPPAQP